MTVAVVRADARDLPLEDGSVDLIVTSPPYFGLRSYTDGGAHYPNQIGSEGTPGEWLDALWACTREWARVLKPEGSLFVNLGDKYAAGHGGRSTMRPEDGGRSYIPQSRTWKDADGDGSGSGYGKGHQSATPHVIIPGTSPKSLLGLPWRYAIGCTDRLGLILRAEIVWAKPNGLPESVQDRVRRAHEQVFHLTRLPRYYAAVDEIREPHEPDSARRSLRYGGKPSVRLYANGDRNDAARQTPMGLGGDNLNPLGKLPGSVWEIPSQPLQVPASLGVDHFAAFPMELPRRLILGWSPPGVCTACGQGRRPVVNKCMTSSQHAAQPRSALTRYTALDRVQRNGMDVIPRSFEATITGYACGCPAPSAPTRPAVVLDPFGGTGTTALVASVLGRHAITSDLSADYCRLAAWRTTDPGERARAMQVPKPPPVSDGQEALFSL